MRLVRQRLGGLRHAARPPRRPAFLRHPDAGAERHGTFADAPRRHARDLHHGFQPLRRRRLPRQRGRLPAQTDQLCRLPRSGEQGAGMVRTEKPRRNTPAGRSSAKPLRQDRIPAAADRIRQHPLHRGAERLREDPRRGGDASRAHADQSQIAGRTAARRPVRPRPPLLHRAAFEDPFDRTQPHRLRQGVHSRLGELPAGVLRLSGRTLAADLPLDKPTAPSAPPRGRGSRAAPPLRREDRRNRPDNRFR